MTGALVAAVAAVSLAAPGPAAPHARPPARAAAHRQSHSHRPHVRLPGQVRGVRVVRRTATGVRIAWRAARPGAAPIEGYRVERNGLVEGQTPGRAYVVRLGGNRTWRIKVIAVDTRGRLGRPSRALRVKWQATGKGVRRAARAAGDEPPGMPGQLGVSEVSESGATVWWIPSHPGSAKIAGYRLYREGALEGQAGGDSMRLGHLAPLRTYHVQVAAVDVEHRESARTPALSLSTSHTPPTGPPLIAAEHVTDTSATLSWQAGSANDAKLVGYLLFENGSPERVVDGQSTTVTLASERHYKFTVRALDSYDYLSAPAPEVEVFTTHTPPSTPGDLHLTEVSASSVALAWAPSTPVSGKIVGYRVFRDEIPVGQVSGTSLTLNNLAPSTTYRFTVVAVDSLGAISVSTAPLSVETSDPPPTHGNVQAFLLASTDQSFFDLEAHYQQIGVVYPTYFNCGPGGEVSGGDWALVTAWARARGIAVMPRLNCQNPNDENQALNEPPAREAMIDRLVSLCESNGYQGIQIDFEGAAPAEREPFTTFITMLAARLHAIGDKLSTVVTAKTSNVMSGRAAMYNDAALAEVSDWVFVLDWGLHWTTSAPGGLAELPWFTKVADYVATMPDRNRFVLGMPLYGLDWPGGGGPANPATPLEYANVIAEQSQWGTLGEWEATAAEPHFSYTDSSGVGHTVWYIDQQAVAVRAQLAESLGLGIGLWHLGSEDQSIWELPQLGGN